MKSIVKTDQRLVRIGPLFWFGALPERLQGVCLTKPLSDWTVAVTGAGWNDQMSALGHKRTFRPPIALSALPPKADICSAPAHVRFGPKADIASFTQLSRRQWRARPTGW